MLNISEHPLQTNLSEVTRSAAHCTPVARQKRTARVLLVLLGVFVLAMFLPWTQNIQSTGRLTTLRPEQRPQSIESVIAGRIQKWYVREGDTVKRGDTILFLTEIKDAYMDPKLLERTELQIGSKEAALNSYSGKIAAINMQITQLEALRKVKYSQASNKLNQEILKLRSDSAELEAAVIDLNIAQTRYDRDLDLFRKKIKSAVEVEARKLALNQALAKKISAENKVNAAQNAVQIARFELNNVNNEYNEKLAKAESERFSVISSQMETESDIAKMRNTYSSYEVRSKYYYITAPQDGIISKTLNGGIGETVKEGAAVATIMPEDYSLAVEVFVEPQDIPLVHLGTEMRFIFDGWPSIVFTGWPNASYGTFGGHVVAIDNIISDNGKYRVLVAPDPTDRKWPVQLRVGSGARGIALLKDVPIWYELWRKLNGFPQDFYKPNTGGKTAPDANKTKK